jgi:hypothetical protein
MAKVYVVSSSQTRSGPIASSSSYSLKQEYALVRGQIVSRVILRGLQDREVWSVSSFAW